MPNVFHAQFDLELLADRLEEMGFTRTDQGTGPTRSTRGSKSDNEPPWNDAEPETDPWADEQPARESRSPARSAPSRGSSRPARPARPAARSNSVPCEGVREDWPVSGNESDRFDREWYFGEPDAPVCYGGHPAAMVDGVSKEGKPYRVWACPVGFTRDYKKKCDLWDYVKD